jgi:hypothetical protein
MTKILFLVQIKPRYTGTIKSGLNFTRSCLINESMQEKKNENWY